MPFASSAHILSIDTTAAPFLSESQSLVQKIEADTTAVAVAGHMNAQVQAQVQAQLQQQVQAQQLSMGMLGITTEQMASAMFHTMGQLPSVAMANGLPMAPSQSSAVATTAAMMHSTQVQQHAHGVAASSQLMPVSNRHSRSASAIDSMVSMYPNGSSSSGTPKNGMVALSASNNIAQPSAAQVKQHLQQQQQAATDASEVAGIGHGGILSPYDTPSANNMGAFVHSGHRRQMSSSFPSAIQQQQQQPIMFIDTPMSMNTGPPTMVPGTPTHFGQVQFPMHHAPSSAGLHLQSVGAHGHQHHSHFGHSRHLSLDAANFRLMGSDFSSLHALPMHGTIHEHPAETMQTMQFGAANSMMLSQQLQMHHQMQLQQGQSQHKTNGPLMVRTMPVTPQHQPVNPFSAGAQPALFSDLTLQQQQQHQQRQRPVVTHHGSCSVDLGSLSSAFNIAQFNQTMSGQMSPVGINPAAMSLNSGDISPMPFAQSSSQMLALTGTIVAPPLASSRVSPAVGSVADFDDDDGEDDEDDDDVIRSGDDAEMDGVEFKELDKSSSGKGAGRPASGAKLKKPTAPYKRFRNSFIFFANEKRRQLKQEHPKESKIQNRCFIQDMSKVWNSMSSDEKAPFVKMAEDDKMRYEADVIKFGPLASSTPSSAPLMTSVTSSSSAVLGVSALEATADATPTTKGKRKASSGSLSSLETPTKSPKFAPVPIAPAPVILPAVVSVPAPVPALEIASEPVFAPAFAPAPQPAESSTALKSSVPAAPTPLIIAASKPAMSPEFTTAAFAPVSALISTPAPVSVSASTAQPSQFVSPATMTVPELSIPQQTPVIPDATHHSMGVPLVTHIDTCDFTQNLLNQQVYLAWMQQAFGQDFSPHADEFDSSCFIGNDPTAADEAAYLNPQSLSSPLRFNPHQPMLAPEGGVLSSDTASKTLSASASAAAASTSMSANGPPITTLVGTKRKSSSDGQPMTNLPMSIKRFRNSFIYFVNERRREVQYSKDGTPTNVEVNNRDFLKEMSTKWRAMSEDEKGPYLRMACADKERFTKEMREYELEHPNEFNKTAKHRRRRSSTSASNVSTAMSIPVDIAAKPQDYQLQPQQQQNLALETAAPLQYSFPATSAPVAAFASGGLNISVLGNAYLPISQSTAESLVTVSSSSVADMPQGQLQFQQQQGWALTSTPMSTTHSTPLLSPTILTDKADQLLSPNHLSSLPLVPEDILISSEPFASISSSGSLAGATVPMSIGVFDSSNEKITTMSTLPTLSEAADEDADMS
ncbi:hypothetical protein GGF37_001553 [Kickxella alabastrina]|nr:hypothetical protein GGF37_001553 [Kickxella alabastrina]